MSDTTPISLPARWFFGIFAGLAVFAVVGIYSSRMAYETTGYDEDQAKERLARLDKLHASDRKTLTTADWIDQAKGTVRIPVDEAMIEELGPLKSKSPRMGTALPVATPKPAAAPTTATNAAPASTNAPTADTNAATANTHAAPAAPAPEKK